MNDNNNAYCPFSVEELHFLSGSETFQRKIASDPVLDRLEALQYDEQAENIALNETLFRPCGKIGSLSILPLTPVCWAMLWSKSSPYVCGGTVHPSDIEQFLFLLTFDFRRGEPLPDNLPHKAAGICRRAGLSPKAVHLELLKRIHTAFLPLQLLPAPSKTELYPPVRFDAEWLNRVCSIASRRTNTPIDAVIREMSMNQVCWQYVNMLRERDSLRMIRRRPDAEISREIMNRVYSLGKDFLKQ